MKWSRCRTAFVFALCGAHFGSCASRPTDETSGVSPAAQPTVETASTSREPQSAAVLTSSQEKPSINLDDRGLARAHDQASFEVDLDALDEALAFSREEAVWPFGPLPTAFEGALPVRRVPAP